MDQATNIYLTTSNLPANGSSFVLDGAQKAFDFSKAFFIALPLKRHKINLIFAA
jgi:hypothetical protein